MHTSALIALLVITTSLAAQSSTLSPPRDSAVVMRQLLALENDVAKANQTCDYALFRRVEAAEFIFTGADGSVTTRAQDLAGESSCHPRTYQVDIDQPRLVLLGNSAVFNAREALHLKDASGQPVIRQSRFTDVFVWREGRWQMVAGHSSKIQ